MSDGMKTADVEILIIPGRNVSTETTAGPDHWQSRWIKGLKTARRVEQADWDTPQLSDWVSNIIAAVDAATRPVLLVAHSCGVAAVVHAAPHLKPGVVVGAFLVAAPDLDTHNICPAALDKAGDGFAPVPTHRLPFSALLIASNTDPYCTLDRATTFAADWGATLVDAGDAGHLNAASGHGPWPDGALRLGTFLRQISAARA
jgi:uncharacterized protein